MIAASLRVFAASLVVLAAAGVAADPPPRPRAAGGVRLVQSAESAPATVVGDVLAVGDLDRHGRSARLGLVRILSGPLEKGSEVTIVWEELAASRGPRLAAGERVLVSLEPLPGASLWRTRLPDPEARARVLYIAQDGDAFLRAPALGTLDTLQHYLWLADEQREGATGADYLASLAARAEEPFAVDALARLADHPRLAREVDPQIAERLVAALLREDASPRLRTAVVALIADHRLETARPALERRAEQEPIAPPELFEALARLDGELSPERSAALLAAAPAPQRRVAVRYLSGPEAVATLEGLLRRDEAPEVRAAAGERLVELRGEQALGPLLDALSDPETPVRGTAARLLAGLGEPAVSPLRQVIGGNDPDAATAAVVALGLIVDPSARAVLREIAADHPESRVRKLAELALVGRLGHDD